MYKLDRRGEGGVQKLFSIGFTFVTIGEPPTLFILIIVHLPVGLEFSTCQSAILHLK